MGYSPLFFIGQTFKNIRRNIGMSIASVLVLLACLLVTGTFYTVDRNIKYNLDGLGGLNKILVYIQEDYEDDRVRAIKEKAEGLTGAAHVTLISKEQALEDEKKRLGEEYAGVFDWLEEGENPYRASLEVEYGRGVDVKALEKELGEIPGVDSVVSRSDMAERVERVKKVVSRVFLVMMVLLFVVSVFVIITSIRLALDSRKKEITVMRYVGASGLFIIIPYLLEGALLGLISSLAAFGIEIYAYEAVSHGAAKELYGLVTLLPVSHFTGPLLLMFLLIGVLTGLAGSVISLARYLNK